MRSIYDEILDERYKGVPLGSAPFELRAIPERRWRVGTPDLPLPLLVARKRALEYNIAAMQRYCTARGADLAPHGKTTMCPQIFDMQLAAGATAITVATAQQLAVCCKHGIRRVLLANQLAAIANVRYAVQAVASDERLQLWTFVDSPEAVRLIAREARASGLERPFDVILEVGYAGGRTGVRSRASARDTAAAITAANRAVRLCGVGGFEGLLANDPRSFTDARAFVEQIAGVIDELIASRVLAEEFIVTAGGSAAFDVVLETFAQRWPGRARVVLRSGCYVTHDHGMYERAAPPELGFQPALELWSSVQSRPEPTLAYLTFGRREAGSDAGMPVPLYALNARREKRAVASWHIEGLNDQHARLRLPPGEALGVGDIVVCGISHPCTTLDKWRLVMLVDDDDVVADGLLTFF
ncbi:MAG TPA: alanine racemase [Candidatus Baltobacteraceae bacterium]